MADSATHDLHGEPVDEHHHHVFDAKVLKKTFIILVCLTLLTVILALFERGFVAADTFGFEFALPFRLPLGWLSVPIALGIAGAKAYWVASRFMGLKNEGGSNVLVFVGSLVFLVIFFGFTFLDFAFRDTFHDLAAVPTDILEEEALTAEEEAAGFQDAYDATPLVRQPDPALFGEPAPASSAPAAAE